MRNWLRTEPKDGYGLGRIAAATTKAARSAATGDGRFVYDPQYRELFAEYHHKDHLGNVRVAFNDRNRDGLVEIIGENNEVTQVNDFYPFGLAQKGAVVAAGESSNRYRYNGKEFSEELGLYDYGARWYDPAVGRWGQVDPLAEDYTSISPYVYVANNPISFIDPDGMRIDVSGILSQKNGLVTLINLLSDLNDATGLNISYKEGELYEKGGEWFGGLMDTPEMFRGGSELARDYIRGLMSSPEVVSVSASPSLSSQATKSGAINLNVEQIENFKTSMVEGGESDRIMDYGMVFLHESLHTDTGATVWNGGKKTSGYSDPVNSSSTKERIEDSYKKGETGDVVDRINMVRDQLTIPRRGAYVTTQGWFAIYRKGKGTKFIKMKN